MHVTDTCPAGKALPQLLLNILKSLPVSLLFKHVLFCLSFKGAKTSWWNVRNSLDCIVPRNILPCSVITCWVLRTKQVCSWHWGNPRPFQDSAGCCGISAGDTASGHVLLGELCAIACTSIFSSLKRNVLEKHLPQCSSSVFFHVLRTCRCSSEYFRYLCSPSKFSSCCCLSTPCFLHFGLFEQIRVLNQVSSS